MSYGDERKGITLAIAGHTLVPAEGSFGEQIRARRRSTKERPLCGMMTELLTITRAHSVSAIHNTTPTIRISSFSFSAFEEVL